MKKKLRLSLIVLLIVFSLLISSTVLAQEEDRFGGTLNTAFQMSVAHLDTDNSTDSMISAMMNHVYEGLFEFDENLNLTPHLAASYEIKENGLVYDVKLREDVRMHNGELMDADDVVASFRRWLEINNGGQLVAPHFDEIEKLDQYNIRFKFEEVYAPFLNILASPVSNQKFVVRAEEVIDEFGTDVIDRHVGTGPYKYEEWVPDQKLVLTRFEDYTPSPREGSFFAGERIPYLDKIVFNFIPDAQVRVSGVQTGQFHFAEEVPRDQYQIFKMDQNIKNVIIYPDRMSMLIFNNAEAPFDNKYARQAIAYALDFEELGYAMIGDPQFWRLESALHEKGNPWHVSDAGAGIYGVYDPEKAKQLLERAGYDGQPLVILSGQDNQMERQGAIAIQDQLEKIGIDVELQLFDRPTVVERRAKKEGWHMHLSPFIKVVPDPQIHQGWTGTNKWITNWDSKDSRQMDQIFAEMLREVDYEQRYKIVERMQAELWDSVPYFNILDYSRLHIRRTELKNFQAGWQPFFWNTYLE
ncbi:peptide/nickel transport system substrate-binding protein [Halanaerobium congolense]|jgi:peptide/nickel transport system substrate-binding protein|uniref:Peptide/nickel transport system substrate-binding protein n=1 Tax=Halanaerobium congolense TaxID=54121 RepID=A0A1I0ANX9_9FIRM|nr:ABC transporter substrate-binding protein [Halanaerobium congolense]PTX16228.1 peptide/nickel transport system substrate-binding protein [Halanaerobium congolense]SDF47594.1 peptide/nickel transport system substrate-binding protein [Halanaerobium congolense]SES95129.1 peptide/nickel transport system substrate-binding protein [Halanaerobium congolense]SFP27796.1 peptide/nickel transport system substrate-binding protein [Halanaerobium congolense]